jgi:hypothetical protein
MDVQKRRQPEAPRKITIEGLEGFNERTAECREADEIPGL